MKETTEYKGIKIGDIILIPTEERTLLLSNEAEVTDFSPDLDVIHWKAKSLYGGILHSGDKFEDIKLKSIT